MESCFIQFSMSSQRCNSIVINDIGSGFEFLALPLLGSNNLGKLSNSFMSCLCFHICRTGILIQLTLEQYEFELHGSTYMHIFFNSKYYGTHDLRLVGCGGSWGPYRDICLTALRVRVPNPTTVQGSTVVSVL